MNNETAHQAIHLTGWRTSSYSQSQDGNCVEVATRWRTSSYSQNEGGACVEVGTSAAAFGIRDTKQAGLSGRARPTLVFGTAAARSFLRAVQENDFDLPR